MSWQDARDPRAGDAGACPPVETVIVPRSSDIGGFEVRRALPSRERRMVGPFVFFDQMGRGRLAPGRGLDVRPHPHINLATVTYLFSGEILHRDSLGSVQPIRPGAVNWMTAGRGIVHSERSGDEQRQQGASLFGVQVWVALPRPDEETEPVFIHHDDGELPTLAGDGSKIRIVVGELFGSQSPVRTYSDTLYVDAALEAGARLPFPALHEERAIYVAEGRISIAGTEFGPAALLVLRPGDEVVVTAPVPARLLFLGGEPLDGPRHIWWNFVSSSRERIQQAKEDWQAGRFAAVPGETEFIPLPEGKPPPVRYP